MKTEPLPDMVYSVEAVSVLYGKKGKSIYFYSRPIWAALFMRNTYDGTVIKNLFDDILCHPLLLLYL